MMDLEILATAALATCEVIILLSGVSHLAPMLTAQIGVVPILVFIILHLLPIDIFRIAWTPSGLLPAPLVHR